MSSAARTFSEMRNNAPFSSPTFCSASAARSSSMALSCNGIAFWIVLISLAFNSGIFSSPLTNASASCGSSAICRATTACSSMRLKYRRPCKRLSKFFCRGLTRSNLSVTKSAIPVSTGSSLAAASSGAFSPICFKKYSSGVMPWRSASAFIALMRGVAALCSAATSLS